MYVYQINYCCCTSYRDLMMILFFTDMKQNLTASLYFCESSFRVTVLTHFYNTYIEFIVQYWFSQFHNCFQWKPRRQTAVLNLAIAT